MKARQWATGVVLMLLCGCAYLGLVTPQTFNERALVAAETVAGLRESTLLLLRADMLTADDAANIQAQLDTARSGIEVARVIYRSDPAAGETRLDGIIVALRAVDAYLKAKGGS